jgi:hypothetical protein
MSNIKKLMMSAAGGEALNVEDVFSTYLYHSNDTSPQQIVNGIDLAGEGGLVWIANRDNGGGVVAFDSERPSNDPFDERLWLYGTQSSYSDSELQITPNSDGFTRTSRSAAIGGQDYDYDYASWTFRKAPKFFDIVTYTGNGSARTISHSLNTTPGLIICKPTSGSGQWAVWHRSNGNDKVLYLNLNYNNSTSNTVWNNTAPTSTVFSVGASAAANETGVSYIAYLFAHNDGDGEFGPDSDQDIIKCGSYTGNGSTNGPEIDLGFEPQWLMVKNTTTSNTDWFICDTMRGIHWTIPSWTNLETRTLKTNTADAEGDHGVDIQLRPTGFKLVDTSRSNASGATFIYVAIRRPMRIPTDGSEVFHVNKFTTTGFTETTGVGFAPDLVMQKASQSGDRSDLVDKIRGPYVNFQHGSKNQEDNSTAYFLGGFLNDGVKMGSNSAGQFNGWNPNTHWYFKRAPGFFDQVAFISSNTPSATNSRVEHGLGVAPEMIWFKPRFYSYDWWVYHKDLGDTTTGITTDIDYRIRLNTDAARVQTVQVWGTSSPTETDFGYNYNDLAFREVGVTAYLFATLPGVSKVGSYTGSTSDQTIDCGFSSGARFVLIKNVSAAQGWALFDTERGIVAGNDPVMFLNGTDAEFTGADYIDPHSSGFTLVGGKTLTNNVTYKYIYYAIA